MDTYQFSQSLKDRDFDRDSRIAMMSAWHFLQDGDPSSITHVDLSLQIVAVTDRIGAIERAKEISMLAETSCSEHAPKLIDAISGIASFIEFQHELLSKRAAKDALREAATVAHQESVSQFGNAVPG